MRHGDVNDKMKGKTMKDQKSVKWVAEAIQSGTNERMWVEGDSKDDVTRKLYGQAYGPKFGSIRYYTIQAGE